MWGGVAIFVVFAPSWCFSIAAGYIVANHPIPSNKPEKLVSGLLIRIISPKVFQENTTILQLKVYIVYVMRKLVGHLNLALLLFLFVCNARSLDHQFFTIFSNEVSRHKVRKVTGPNFWKYVQMGLAWRT